MITVGGSCLGLLPLLLGHFDPLLWIAWLSVIALPTGVFIGARALRLWPFGLAVPGIWMIVLVALEAEGGGALPEPAWAAASWTGLFVLGFALGPFFLRHSWTALGLSLCLSTLLAALPLSGGEESAAWAGRSLGQASPALAALAFDASPMTLVLESGGVDWMRHRAVYTAAGTEWFSDRRQPYRGKLAASLVLLVGYVLNLLTRSRSARSRAHASASRALANHVGEPPASSGSSAARQTR